MLGLTSLVLVGSLVVTAPATAEPVAAALPASAPETPPADGKIQNALATDLGDKGSSDFYIEFSEHAALTDFSARAGSTDWATAGCGRRQSPAGHRRRQSG